MRWIVSCILSAAACSAAWVPVAGDPSMPAAKERGLEQRREFPEERSTNTTTWPYGPLKTKGRDIVNSRGDTVVWAGVNWPASGETMIPEGLEWKSVEDILDDIASVGFNYIRLGYAIEMVDQIYDRDGADVPLEVSMISALGHENGTRVTAAILEHNPSWTVDTTRFDIWSHIAKLALDRHMYLSPDVHVGKASWCCSHTDGNAWFDDVHFPSDSWRRGLSYVANWATDHPNVASMSLRNELRESWNRTDLVYNWVSFVGNMTAGADAIHEANPDVLITWSGLQYDEDLSALTTGKNLYTAECYKCTAVRDGFRRDPALVFDLAEHAWADKVVWELHLYPMSEDVDTGTCPMIEAAFYRNGFNALGIESPVATSNASAAVTDYCDAMGCAPAVRKTPVIISEFGNAQDTSLYTEVLQKCLRQYTVKHGVSWMVWSVAGSYRIRQGVQGFDDTWGLTNYDWSGWRSPETIENYWKPWVREMGL